MYSYVHHLTISVRKAERCYLILGWCQEVPLLEQSTLNVFWFPYSFITFAMTSGSGSSIGSAHSTVTTFPQTFTLPLINLRLAWAAVLWSSYSRKQKPRFFFLSSGWWYNMTSVRPSEIKQNICLLRLQSMNLYYKLGIIFLVSMHLTSGSKKAWTHKTFKTTYFIKFPYFQDLHFQRQVLDYPSLGSIFIKWRKLSRYGRVPFL